MIVLIPAYEPDERLVDLVAQLASGVPGLGVVVVDDGSGPRFREVFDRVRSLGATVVGHDHNKGKGAALRTGFAYVERCLPGRDVVCADSDGQHTVLDVLRVADRVRTSPGATVLGARQFTGHVPLRSRLGNAVTRALFRAATGLRIQDTQTGLRGYPAAMLGWLQTIPGDRFEYELEVLLRASRADLEIEEIEIATIYLEGNASSHFRPVADSARIYAPLLRFTASSLLAFAVDTLALLVLDALTGSLLTSVLGARAVSSAVNFVVNRRLVFDRAGRSRLSASALRYGLLVVGLLGANYAGLWALTGVGLPLLLAKAIVELTLFLVSFQVQRRVVFGAPGRAGSELARV